MIVAIILSLCILIGTIILCIRELLIAFYNPLPKFENGDKQISDIEVKNFRHIEQYVNTEFL